MQQAFLDLRLKRLKFQDLSQTQPEHTKTKIEQAYSENGLLSVEQNMFCHDGVLRLQNLIPEDVIDAYVRYRSTLPYDGPRDNFRQGWHYPTPFMVHEPLRDIALHPNLMSMLEHLIGEPMGLNLALTGWVSTQRNWHQDTYLNPTGLWSKYIAVWIALDDINPASGPFEFVRGSHHWPVLMKEKLFTHLTPDEQQSPHWPTFTQDHVARMCEEEMRSLTACPELFIAKKGEVLFWHSNLMHRGSKPWNPEILRKGLICHYSSVPARMKLDMPRVKTHKGGYYFDLPVTGEVRP